jgi:hypothetical protein
MISEDIPDIGAESGDQTGQRTSFRLLLGSDLQLLARHYQPAGGDAGAETHIQAFDGHGNFLITLALIRDGATVPDSVIAAAVQTARVLYPKRSK